MSLLIWFAVNVLLAITVNVYFWRRTSKLVPTNVPKSRSGFIAAKLSLFLILNSWALGVFFYKMARHLGAVAGIDSPMGLISAGRDESSMFLSLLLLSYLSPALILFSLPLGVIGVVLANRGQDTRTRLLAVAAIALNLGIIVFWCFSLGMFESSNAHDEHSAAIVAPLVNTY